MRKRFGVLLLASYFGACGSPHEDITRDAGAPIQTHQLRYTVQTARGGVEFSIPFTYRNRSSDSVFLVNCRYGTRQGNRTATRLDLSMDLQKNVGRGWKRVWSASTLACLSEPVWIAPGAAYSDTLRVFGARPGQPVFPEFEVARVAGEYRLVWHQVRRARSGGAYPNGDTLPLDARISNRFVLTGGW